MHPGFSWNIPAEPVKNTFPPDFTIPKTSVCSRDNETFDSHVICDFSALDEGSLGAEGSETVGIGLLSLGGGINARRPVEPSTPMGGFGGLRPGIFIHSCASARLRNDLYLFPGYLLTYRVTSSSTYSTYLQNDNHLRKALAQNDQSV